MAGIQSIGVPNELYTKLEDAARAENSTPAELVERAVKDYLEQRGWQQLLKRAHKRTKALGLTERDVPRLIAESRRERAERGQ